MYDAATNSCSFGLSQVSDLTTRRSGPHPPCGQAVQVKIEECLSNTAEDWAAGCAYRFAARRCYMASEDNAAKAATTADSNRVLDPGGFNSALAATFRNRYLGASAFSNPPTLFPGSYVGGTDIGKQQAEVPTALNGNAANNSTQGQHPGVEVAPRSSSPPPVNSSSSSTSSSRSNHQVDSATSKGKGGDRRVVVPAGEYLECFWNNLIWLVLKKCSQIARKFAASLILT
ncbi:hypothetical protein AVEN_200867-1 [Araneus ventricosus]|uniref:Uncharacterized protein n=1 Tax=Araneus ventricosus TaxID=182803 RepID=A0A4Y2LZT8_ARAVE|nr:hypothetical protein AVEN_200867-1 [Araneus ventricosus]